MIEKTQNGFRKIIDWKTDCAKSLSKWRKKETNGLRKEVEELLSSFSSGCKRNRTVYDTVRRPGP